MCCLIPKCEASSGTAHHDLWSFQNDCTLGIVHFNSLVDPHQTPVVLVTWYFMFAPACWQSVWRLSLVDDWKSTGKACFCMDWWENILAWRDGCTSEVCTAKYFFSNICQNLNLILVLATSHVNTETNQSMDERAHRDDYVQIFLTSMQWQGACCPTLAETPKKRA